MKRNTGRSAAAISMFCMLTGAVHAASFQQVIC